MKRRAFLFAILSVFALTSCSLLPNMTPSRRNKSSSEESGEVSDSSKYTKHAHVYGEWMVTISPTCTEPGREERCCIECGQTQTRTTPAFGHDFQEQEIIVQPTCFENGDILYKCTICGATEIREVKGGHDWSAPTYHGFVDDQVQYNSYQCLRCFEYSKIEFAAVDGTLAPGSAIKSGTPEGFLKLQGNNQSISWKFDLSSLSPASSYCGILYQRACMDSFSNNTNRTYGSYSTSSSATTEEGNFRVEINGEVVDKTPYMSITYGELLAEGEDSSWLGDNYSPIALCPIGQVFLTSGINEMRYTRIGSYNLTILDFVMVISPFDHEHLASSTWFCDNEYHWHECVNAGCPLEGRRLDVSAHVWGERYDEVAATCSARGSYKQRCSICAYERTVEVDTVAHSWGEWTIVKAATCDEAGIREHECSVCFAKEQEEIAVLQHVFEAEPVQVYSATDSYVREEFYNCTLCNKAGLKWSALDYDVTKSTDRSDSDKGPKLVDSNQAVDFNDSAAQGGGENHEQKGTHIVYNLDIPYAIQNANLYMLASKNQWTTEPFDRTSVDINKGYEMINGEWIRPESRYGLKVDGQLYMIDKNGGAIKAESTAKWMKFPGISLNLTSGIHEIEFFKYGGYSANHYAFMITGFDYMAPMHGHNYSEWQSDDETHWKYCTSDGCFDPEGTRYQEESHSWGDVIVTVAPGHETLGSGIKECAVCGKRVTVSIPATGHTWVADSEVAAEEGMIGYSVYHCLEDLAKKLTIKALDGTFADGSSNKSGTPDGYMKLTNNGNSISYTFNYDGAATTAKIYQRAILDNWSANQGRSYSSIKNGTSDDSCNFAFSFNGAAVDMSETRSITYGEFLGGGEESGFSGYSPVADCLIGEISLVNGVNSFTYQRLDSYNLTISDFVIVID